MSEPYKPLLHWKNLFGIAQKELLGFFASLTAFIFFGAFLAVTLFVFFFWDPFFVRHVADVRTMFESMPVLLIFLVPALTMRMWSEERRSGTLEFLLTMPISNIELVLGKFVACLTLVCIALLLTLPIPITVSLFFGQLDWGPVLGGYIATIFLAASYAAIGPYVSARTDNQIVSLLLTVLVCGILLLVGADNFTGLFNDSTSVILKLLGSGARFQSITRGIIDFRDLYYYLSIAGVFLSLNTLGLEKLRWSGNRKSPRHDKLTVITWLVIGNLLAANLWLQQVAVARVDMTEGQIYTLSDSTRNYLSRLQEPLVIRAYFSKKTHPYLTPLVPRLRDLLREYATNGKGKVQVVFIDPIESPQLEKEAAEKYGIKPTTFQTNNKYQTALTNSYFDIVISYGDQFEKLGLRDLIGVTTHNQKDVEVDLRNPEYDITSAIKKVMYAYQGSGNLFLGINHPINFTAYISASNRLPEPLQRLETVLKETMTGWQKQSDGKLSVAFVDPDADGGKVAQILENQYGFKPVVAGLLDAKPFWFCLTFKDKDQLIQLALPDVISQVALERNLKAGLKRFSKGSLKTIGLVVPQSNPMPFMAPQPKGGAFSALRRKLANNYAISNVELDEGKVPPDVDLLLVVAPEHLGDPEIFAIDQFLMRGGTVILSTAPFDVGMDQALQSNVLDSGLQPWLTSFGIDIEKTTVLDQQNFPLPIPVQRDVGGYVVREMQLLPYPYFIDIRKDGMGGDEQMTAGVNQVILDWASPLQIDNEKNKQRKLIRLLQSSKDSWTSSSSNVAPDFKTYPKLGFLPGPNQGRKLLAVTLEGKFDSFFKGKQAPVPHPKDKSKPFSAAQPAPAKESLDKNTIDKSPDSSRIIVFASNSFLSDKMLILANQSLGSQQYWNPIDLLQDTIDWSLQDRELLTIRARNHFTRVLRPVDPLLAQIFEYTNYGLAVGGLFLIWAIRRNYASYTRRRYATLLNSLKTSKTAEEVAS